MNPVYPHSRSLRVLAALAAGAGVALAVGAGVALVAGAGAAFAAPPGISASVKVGRCHQATDAGARYVTFKGRMTTGDRTLRMQMRFTVMERTGSSWADVTPPEVAVWNQSQPGSRAYVFSQRIDNLKVGAAYRTVARFRWLDDAGRTVAAAKRKSRVCKMRDLRPDLVPGRIVADRTPEGGETRYVLEVVNRGKVAASGFSVEVSANGASLYAASGLSVAAGKRKKLAFSGPACLTGTIVARIDSGGQIDETSETNNEVSVSCPVG